MKISRGIPKTGVPFFWSLRRHMLMVYYGTTDSRTPVYATLPALLGIIYLLSPIDLIPDVIPIVGYLDDLVVVSFLFRLSIRLLPAEVFETCLEKSSRQSRRINYFLTLIFVFLLALLAGSIFLAVTAVRALHPVGH